MAVITSAALAGTAITAATIASGVGVAATAATTGMSFINAGKQKKAMQQAEKDADAAMQEARKKLQVNVYDKLAINKEPFELQREAMLSQGAQAIQAGVESERGAAATAGRVQLAQQEGQAGIRTAMSDELQALQGLSAQEDSRLRDIGVQLDLEEVAGAQLAAANAQELQAQAKQQGFEGLTSIGSQLADSVPLFSRDRAAEKSAIGGLNFTPEQKISFEKAGGMPSIFEGGDLNFGNVSSMNNPQYNKFIKSLTKEQRNMIFSNPEYIKSLNSVSSN
jgi:hypothetical protein